MTVNVNPETGCGTLGRIAPNSLIYPVVVYSDWYTGSFSVLTGGMKASLYIDATLYILAAFYAACISVLILFSRDIKLHHMFAFFLIPLFVIRGVYFYLIAAQTITDTSVADYVMQELPTFLFMTIYTFIIYMLTSILIQTTHWIDNKKLALFGARVFFIVLNIWLYMLYIMLIVLFDQLDSSPSSGDCPGRVPPPSPNDSAQQIIRIVYRSVISAFAILFAFLFISVGGILYVRIRRLAEDSSSSRAGQKIFLVGIICAIAFVLHAIILLIFAATNWTSPYSVWFLVAVEIVPGVLMITILAPTRLSTARVQKTFTATTSLITGTTSGDSSSISSSSSSSSGSSTTSLASSSSVSNDDL